MKRVISVISALLLGFGSVAALPYQQDGVSWALAQSRQQQVSQIVYNLQLAVPDRLDQPVEGSVTICFCLNKKYDVVLDFQGELTGLAPMVNGHSVRLLVEDEHIVIPKKYMRKGENIVRLSFKSTDQALNRHDDYLYTLFVPDHARSCFPCFDQPDLKAIFHLTLSLPDGWTSISSDETKPLPTYLFSFTAGRFERVETLRDGRQLTVLHRETDPAKVAQLHIVFDQMALSLRWLEQYTGIDYPFSRYGAVVLPGYQFGGMEHPGAIQLNANTIFLPSTPTPDEEMNRLNLIAHETSHMWFGDLVTMRWFNDVWTKEVFANLMADKIAREQFPDIDHDLSFLKAHYPAALSTDRTDGTHPIQQPLDNLNQAGLLYGNIIYHKAPIMMSKLEECMGEARFQRGLQKYLRKYSYDNATWDDLIAILDAEAPEAGIADFDREWVKQAGLRDIDARQDSNADGRGFGRYKNIVVESLDITKNTCRYGRMMMLYENWMMGVQNTKECLSVLLDALEKEQNALVASTCCSYIFTMLDRQQERSEVEERLYGLAQSHGLVPVRQQLMRYLSTSATTPRLLHLFYDIWKEQSLQLFSEIDYMRMSYHLAISMPEQWQTIVSKQRSRLTNPDRQREYDYVSRACNPSLEAQDSLFASLRQKQNRSVEPWTCSLVALLNAPERAGKSLRFITPGLELLPELQRTGGIFFPRNWLSALLGGHHSLEARRLVDDYLLKHQDLMAPLRLKVLEQAYYIVH